MLSSSQEVGRRRGLALWNVLQEDVPLTALFSKLDAVCRGPWLDAGLEEARTRYYVRSIRQTDECLLMEFHQLAFFAEPDGPVVMRVVFVLMLDVLFTGNIDACVELQACTFFNDMEGPSRFDVQLTQGWTKMQSDENVWPAVEEQLTKEFSLRAEGKKPSIPFDKMLSNIAYQALDQLVP